MFLSFVRDESQIVGLQQNPQQNGESPARAVVSSLRRFRAVTIVTLHPRYPQHVCSTYRFLTGNSGMASLSFHVFERHHISQRTCVNTRKQRSISEANVINDKQTMGTNVCTFSPMLLPVPWFSVDIIGVMSYLVMSYLVKSYLVMSCLILSYLIMSYPVRRAMRLDAQSP